MNWSEMGELSHFFISYLKSTFHFLLSGDCLLRMVYGYWFLWFDVTTEIECRDFVTQCFSFANWSVASSELGSLNSRSEHMLILAVGDMGLWSFVVDRRSLTIFMTLFRFELKRLISQQIKLNRSFYSRSKNIESSGLNSKDNKSKINGNLLWNCCSYSNRWLG